MSVSAFDLDASLEFYRDLFGMQSVPSPNFGFRVEWLRCGDLQLHLFSRGDDSPAFHHFGVTVDDFLGFYKRAKQLSVLDDGFFFEALYELPDGTLQMYIRDPSGNLVEIDQPGATIADIEAIRVAIPELKALADVHPQLGEHAQAQLFLTT